jgi:predicted enzyme related to lactoylglutathione lyase
MQLKKIYSVLLADDIDAAEAWYSKLLGRPPDFRPMKTMVQWEISDRGGLAVASDDIIGSTGAVFLVVDDIETERRRLNSLDIEIGDDLEGDYSTLAQVADPDGNLITLATPPSRPYPPA